MKFLIQRVTSAEVSVLRDTGLRETVGSIGKGFLVLIGISDSDNTEIADKLIHKLVNLRIFQDEQGKTNLNIDAVDGSMLLISQFTLYADCKHGNRPSFTEAGNPKDAENLYNYIVDKCREKLEAGETKRIATGEFGGDMSVSLVNDGPFTIILDSRDL